MKRLIISFVAFLSVAVVVVLFLGDEKDLPENHTFAAKFDKEELVGTWEAEWQVGNNSFYGIMTIYDDGHYESIEYRNGVFYETLSCEWRVNNYRSISFYTDESCTHALSFTHENGNLTCGAAVYRKLST